MSDGQKMFSIQRVYLKDASFESPAVPELFFERVEPRIDIEYRVDTRTVEEGRYETLLAATVTARTDERTIFLIEASVGGLFGAKGFDDAELKQVLNVFGPAQLFPYLREAVSNISTRGGFAPVLLALVNFEEMYAEAQRARN